MASLLVRDIDEETKRALAIRAAQNGRSQQAEALAILHAALQPEKRSWVQMLAEEAQEVGGMEIPLPQRHTPRYTGVLM